MNLYKLLFNIKMLERSKMIMEVYMKNEFVRLLYLFIFKQEKRIWARFPILNTRIIISLKRVFFLNAIIFY